MPASKILKLPQEQKFTATMTKDTMDSPVRRKRGWTHFMRKCTQLPVDSSVTSHETSSTIDGFCEVGSTSSSSSESSTFIGVDHANSSTVCRSILKVKTHNHSITLRNLSSQTASDTLIDTGIESSTPTMAVVKFGTITIHNHVICLGDNPSVSIGPPLGISWAADFSATLAVDAYEKTKPTPRDRQEMLVPLKVREMMLIEVGHSRLELSAASRQANAVRQSRRKSANDGHFKQSINKLLKRVTMSSKLESGDYFSNESEQFADETIDC